METNKWWGYIHENGTLQVKRFFDEEDRREATTSPFVRRVLAVVVADGREAALYRLERQINKEDK